MIKSFSTLNEIIKRVHDRDASPLVIKFHATWCKPCKEVAPLFESLVKKFPGTEFASVDIDDVGAAIELYSVKTIPAIHVWNRGGRVAILAKREEFSGIEPLLVYLRDHNPGVMNQCNLEVAHENSSDNAEHKDVPIKPQSSLDLENVPIDTTPINFGLNDDQSKIKLPALAPSKSEKRKRS